MFNEIFLMLIIAYWLIYCGLPIVTAFKCVKCTSSFQDNCTYGEWVDKKKYAVECDDYPPPCPRRKWKKVTKCEIKHYKDNLTIRNCHWDLEGGTSGCIDNGLTRMLRCDICSKELCTKKGENAKKESSAMGDGPIRAEALLALFAIQLTL